MWPLWEKCATGEASEVFKSPSRTQWRSLPVAWDPDVALSAPSPAHLPVCHHAATMIKMSTPPKLQASPH